MRPLANVALEQTRALLMAAAPPPLLWEPLQLNLRVDMTGLVSRARLIDGHCRVMFVVD